MYEITQIDFDRCMVPQKNGNWVYRGTMPHITIFKVRRNWKWVFDGKFSANFFTSFEAFFDLIKNHMIRECDLPVRTK